MLDEGAGGVVEDVVHSHDLDERRGVDPVADRHAALAPDDGVLSDQAVPSDANPRVRQVPEVVHVQHRAVHHERSRADLHSVRAGVDVDALVQVRAVTQADVVGETEPHTTLDGRPALHVKHQPVDQRPQRDAGDGRHPTYQRLERLLQHVASQVVGLSPQVEPRAAAGAMAHCLASGREIGESFALPHSSTNKTSPTTRLRFKDVSRHVGRQTCSALPAGTPAREDSPISAISHTNFTCGSLVPDHS